MVRVSLPDYLPCVLPRLFGLHARRAGAAQALSVAEFKALAYSKDHREPCAKRAPPRWALQCRPGVAHAAHCLINRVPAVVPTRLLHRDTLCACAAVHTDALLEEPLPTS